MRAHYFAAEAPRKLAEIVMDKIDTRKQTLDYNGVAKVRYRNRCAYYTALDAGTFASSLDTSGTHGELIEGKDNQLRSLCRQFSSLVTKQRLDFECHAPVTDTNSLSDTRLASGIITSVITSQNLEIQADRLA